MPRTGGIYNAPAGTKGVPNTTIQSAPYNALIDDLVQDANNPRPITAGGTGAADATTARSNLGAMASADLANAAVKSIPVDNDTFVIIDSEASFATKRLPWLYIKNALRNLFDPLYYLPSMNTIELGANQAVDTVAAIDLHATPASDYNARIMRVAGANGDLQIIQTGTGDIRFTGANVRIAELLVVMKSITSLGGITADSNSFSQISLRDLAGTEKAAIYAQNVGGPAFLRVAGSVTYTFGADGKFTAPSSLGAGSASLNSDGNVSGSVWSGWNATYTDAFNAINARIEQRGAAYLSNAVQKLGANNLFMQWGGSYVNLTVDSTFLGGIITTSNIGSAVGAIAVGSVGSHIFATGTQTGEGQPISGANLQYSNAAAGNTTPVLSGGSWYCAGRAIAGSAQQLTTLWVRYA